MSPTAGEFFSCSPGTDSTGIFQNRRMRRRLSSDDYTVALICALPLEKSAVEHMMDEVYEVEAKYVTGKISDHNVVIANPAPYGLQHESAATVARKLLESFKHLQVILLVGIGGGVAASGNGIRLGDIVVTEPTADSQHLGFCKTMEGAEKTSVKSAKTLEVEKSLMLLTNALSRIQSRWGMDEERRSHCLGELSHSTAHYTRHRSLSNKFNEAEYDDEGMWKTCDVFKSEKLTSRPSWRPGGPIVHYGTMAPGNQTMNNAIMSAEMKNIDFEMDAAGLTSHLPYVIIRGVCDYADSHRNDCWQTTAAMFTRELVATLSHQQVIGTSLVTSTMLQSVITDVADRLFDGEISESIAHVIDWLTPIDAAAQQRDFLEKRTEGTALWLLHSKKFQAWTTGERNSNLLWLKGNPGAGKTVLCATVVDHLASTFSKNDRVGIAYLYPEFAVPDVSRSAHLLAVLLKQLVQSTNVLPESLNALYKTHIQRQSRPSFKELLYVFGNVLHGYSRVFLVIDGLDEMESLLQDGNNILDSIFQLQEENRIHLFLSKRLSVEEPADEAGTIVIPEYDHHKDIKMYLAAHLQELLQPIIAQPDDFDHLLETFVDTVDGGFLRAKVLVHLSSRQTNLRNIYLTIKKFQNLSHWIDGLHELYTCAMKEIESEPNDIRVLAKRTLAWVVHAKRPLTTAELCDVFSKSSQALSVGPDGHLDLFALQSACLGLISIEKHCNKVRLLHSTAQQFFESRGSFWLPNAEAEKYMTLTCLTYLSSAHTSYRNDHSHHEVRRLKLLPLYNYAARYWGDHARAVLGDVKMRVLDFLQCRENVCGCWKAIADIIPGHISNHSNCADALHIAAYFGLADVTSILLDHGSEVNSTDAYGRTPLWWACATGHEKVVQILIDSGADADCNEKFCQNSLLKAVLMGNDAVVKILLHAGARSDFQDENGRTLVSWASELGHEQIFKSLVGAGLVDVNRSDPNGRTPLSWAAEKNHLNIVQLILGMEHVNPDYLDKCHRSPLSWASENGCIEVVKALLACDLVNPDSRDVDGRSPLWWAAEKGHADIVTILISRNTVQLYSLDKYGQTPLSRVVAQGNVKIVQILQRAGLRRAFQELDLTDGYEHPANKQWEDRNRVQRSYDQTVVEMVPERETKSPNKQPVRASKGGARLIPWKRIDYDAFQANSKYQTRIMLLEQEKRRRLMK